MADDEIEMTRELALQELRALRQSRRAMLDNLKHKRWLPSERAAALADTNFKIAALTWAIETIEGQG